MEEAGRNHGASSRRDILKKGAVAAGAIWTAPLVFAQPVAAAVGSGIGFYQYCFDDASSEGWTLNGLWNVTNDRSVSPDYSLHYGTGVGGTYNTGAANSGTATSPVFTVPTTGSQDLVFEIWREIETFGSGTWDEFTVTVAPANDVIYAVSIDGGTMGLWETITLSLAAYAGTAIQLVFGFDTKDGNFNDFEGVYVDNIVVPGGTPPGGAAFSVSAAPSLNAAEQALSTRPQPTKREIARRDRLARADRFANGVAGDEPLQSGIRSTNN